MAIPRPAPGQTRWWVIGTIGVLLGVALATWWGVSASRGVSWSDAGHDTVSAREVRVTFDVINQDGHPVTCTLQALDVNHGQVGISTVKLPASNFESTRYTRSVATVSRAVTGTVTQCTRD